MAPQELSVVIPLRNRAGVRLENCLASLRWQDVSILPEVILSDFGSTPDSSEQIQETADRYQARIVHTDTDEIWNRSRALNIGIQAATGQIVMCTDCDMIFAPDFLKTALDTISDSDGQTLVLCACRDLPESLAEQRWSVDDFPRLLQAAPSYRKGGGTGACQVACRQWFVDVRGYDEKYVFWGYEDKDLVRRASKSGLALRWIHDRTQMLHQWHPTTKFDRLWRRRLNRLRYKLTGGVVRKNRSGWGTLDR